MQIFNKNRTYFSAPLTISYASDIIAINKFNMTITITKVHMKNTIDNMICNLSFFTLSY